LKTSNLSKNSNPELCIEYNKIRKKQIREHYGNSAMMPDHADSVSVNVNNPSLNQNQPPKNAHHVRKGSKATAEAKLKLAETHEIPQEWETNIEKVTNLLEYQNNKISNIIYDFQQEQDEIEDELQDVMNKLNLPDEQPKQ
jgi:hypothetical protein